VQWSKVDHARWIIEDGKKDYIVVTIIGPLKQQLNVVKNVEMLGMKMVLLSARQPGIILRFTTNIMRGL
jgi:hypothetical protein